MGIINPFLEGSSALPQPSPQTNYSRIKSSTSAHTKHLSLVNAGLLQEAIREEESVSEGDSKEECEEKYEHEEIRVEGITESTANKICVLRRRAANGMEVGGAGAGQAQHGHRMTQHGHRKTHGYTHAAAHVSTTPHTNNIVSTVHPPQLIHTHTHGGVRLTHNQPADPSHHNPDNIQYYPSHSGHGSGYQRSNRFRR